MIAALLLPSRPSNLDNALQDLVSRVGRGLLLGPTGLDIVSRGNRGHSAPLGNGLMASKRVVGPIAGDLGNLTIDAIEQTGQNLAVVIVVGGDLSDPDLTGRFIDAKMKLAPGPSLAHAMLPGFPFPFPVDFDAGGIDHAMASARSRLNRHGD